jgi:hypothetical protein
MFLVLLKSIFMPQQLAGQQPNEWCHSFSSLLTSSVVLLFHTSSLDTIHPFSLQSGTYTYSSKPLATTWQTTLISYNHHWLANLQHVKHNSSSINPQQQVLAATALLACAFAVSSSTWQQLTNTGG